MDNTTKTKLEMLRELMETKQFHHATLRLDPGLGGLWIYKKDPNGFRGYSLAGFSFPLNDPDHDAAWNMVRITGVSMGSYGR